MQLCRVAGTTVATVKAPGLADFKLLNVKPAKSGGDEFVAVDTVGAGAGDLVLVALGSAARELEGTRGLAIDAAIVAIVDQS
jgi:ethanolamine utilization protein EutN